MVQINFFAPEKMRDDANVESAKAKTTVSEVLRALLAAWLKKDRRALELVKEFSTKE